MPSLLYRLVQEWQKHRPKRCQAVRLCIRVRKSGLQWAALPHHQVCAGCDLMMLLLEAGLQWAVLTQSSDNLTVLDMLLTVCIASVLLHGSLS
jgi:hypothetical protein